MDTYHVVYHPDRSSFGAELEIDVPQSRFPVIVAQDVFGERRPRMQLLIFPACDAPETEQAVSVRFNPDGTIAEVCFPEGVETTTWNDASPGRWLTERDGR